MCVHGSQNVYCTTELCLYVDKLKERKKTRKERCCDGVRQHSLDANLSRDPRLTLLRLETIAAHLLARNFERESSNNHTERKEVHKSPGSRQEHNTKPTCSVLIEEQASGHMRSELIDLLSV